MLRIFNSLTGKKQEFKPIKPGKVRMYVCGMTVYDFCHIGHARVMVVFDMVSQYMRSIGLDVTYVRNITDIDDKIINRANENGEDISDLTARFISAMNEDATSLGVKSPDAEPKATEHMSQIISMIEKLIENKYAYAADNGDVFYDVSAFSDYGKLSGKKIDELRAGERVEVQEAKDDPLDFVLWKASKPNEPDWASPWGPGRPGWHIECSAMSTHCLGDHFDIHGGGQDLQFPHHENEIAQSEGATGKPFVNLWMHNGFVRVDEEKMSKSLNNFFTVREVLKKYKPEEIRFFILASHYRSPLNYSLNNLDEARAALKGLYTSLRGINIQDEVDAAYLTRFNEVMDDDFNTPKAIALLHELAREINRIKDSDSAKIQDEKVRKLASTLKTLAGILGLLEESPDEYLKRGVGTDTSGLSDDEIQTLVAKREQARKDKDFTESDRIRDLLTNEGIALEDTADG
ncbi:MAG: cysteine--tRNA ligase, partial [Gammaproteobacteria bacterium]